LRSLAPDEFQELPLGHIGKKPTSRRQSGEVNKRKTLLTDLPKEMSHLLVGKG
jgi:hypothetical protein